MLITLDEYLRQEVAKAQEAWRLQRSIAQQHETAVTEHAHHIRLVAANGNNLASPPLAVRHCGADAPTGDSAALLVGSPAPLSGVAASSGSGMLKGRADVLAARLCSVCACRQLQSESLLCWQPQLRFCRPATTAAEQLAALPSTCCARHPARCRAWVRSALNFQAVATAGACGPVWYKPWRGPIQQTQCPAHLCSCQ